MGADTKWLERFCDKDRPMMTKPFAWTFDGEPYTVATDGKLMILLRGDHGYGPAPEGLNMVRAFGGALEAERCPIRVADLRAFLGIGDGPICEKCQGQEWDECSECEGEGQSDCHCGSCGDEHERDCRACGGLGKIGCRACQPSYGTSVYDRAWFGLGLFNRNLMRPAVRRFSDETVTWQQGSAREHPALIRGAEMSLLVCPMTREFEDAHQDKPRFAPLAAYPVAPVAVTG